MHAQAGKFKIAGDFRLLQSPQKPVLMDSRKKKETFSAVNGCAAFSLTADGILV
jgi:hypothetical protein